MLVKNIMVIMFSVVLSGLLNTTGVLAGEVQRSSLTNEEISVLQELGGSEIQNILSADPDAIAKFSNKRGIDSEKVKEALANFSVDDRQALLSVSPNELDLIIAGAMEAWDETFKWVAAVALISFVVVILF